MAQRSHATEYKPSITRNGLEYALKGLKTQYVSDDNQFIPQIVYLKELPGYNDFFVKFLIRNQLCVLSEVATRQWRSRQEWVCGDGTPNMDFLLHAFGDATVPVANCKSKEYSAHAKQEMKMEEFLTYWRQYRDAGHPPEENSLYLKDWHFTRDFPDYNAYSTCSYFRSDWMNEFWDVRADIEDDYRFVYMGPKNTWTPFHADVFRSFSWSANICGRKRWIFFPPGEEDHLRDVHNNLVYDVTTKELEDALKFPNAGKVKHRIEIIQHPGETIFVPSGWHHQVENLEDTISINHNWLNGCNVRQCWNHLKSSLGDVEREISDCRDMDGFDQQCQTILRALTGLDYSEFFRFMESIARRRIRALSSWKQRAENPTSPHCDLSTSRRDTNDQPLASEFSQLGLENRDRDRESGDDVCECGEDVLDLCEGESVTRQGVLDLCEGESVTRQGVLDLCEGESVTRQGVLDLCEGESVTRQGVLDLCEGESVTRQGVLDLCEGESVTRQGVLDLCEGESVTRQGVLDLCEGESVTRPGVLPPHWSQCNVNHALFDLASVALVLRDMRQHVSEEASADPQATDTLAETQQCGKGDVPCSRNVDRNCPEASEHCERWLGRLESLIKEIGQCLSVFGLEEGLEL